jgi:hypothetical protein
MDRLVVSIWFMSVRVLATNQYNEELRADYRSHYSPSTQNQHFGFMARRFKFQTHIR